MGRTFSRRAAFEMAPAILLAARGRAQTRIFDVRNYGARGDGTTLDSAAIQRAIDEAAAAGKGSPEAPNIPRGTPIFPCMGSDD